VESETGLYRVTFGDDTERWWLVADAMSNLSRCDLPGARPGAAAVIGAHSNTLRNRLKSLGLPLPSHESS
jgi:hypothetical protein